MRKLLPLLGALLFFTSCYFPIPMWPHLPPKGTCRNFYMTDWGGQAPYSELQWGPGLDVVHIDEPMLPMWGWKGDLNNRDDVCGEIGIKMVRAKVDEARMLNPGSKIWLNWSTDELEAMARAQCGEPLGLGADVVSFDSYGGIWDWPNKTQYILDMMFRTLEPGQQIGLVPEAFRFPDGWPDYEPIDYVMINTLYFDWAMRHSHTGRVYAMAPFYYKSMPGMVGFEDMPQTLTLLSNLTVEYPLCKNQ